MRILYCDCFSGISGDMFLGSLIDAGLPVEYLNDQLKLLAIPEFGRATSNKVKKNSIVATRLTFEIKNETDENAQIQSPDNTHRHVSDISARIMSSGLSGQVKDTSLKVFNILAEAESKVHGIPVEDVHFHEVGAVDSILDIVGTAIGLEYFNIEKIYSSALPLGSGTVTTMHGILPIPAPATAELLRMKNAPVSPSTATVELVTPTGAAILVALGEFAQPSMKIDNIGVGAGQRDLNWPNVMRVYIGHDLIETGSHLLIETNIDDMNPQIFGFVMDKLFKAGALDVFFTPIIMKKNRPATKLSVIANKNDEQLICDLILNETSTLGVRVNPVSRHEAKRETRMIDTRYGKIQIKLKIVHGQVIQASPEYDDCVRAAELHNKPVAEILLEASNASRSLLNHD